jgi:hypothetical protein
MAVDSTVNKQREPRVSIPEISLNTQDFSPIGLPTQHTLKDSLDNY